MWTQRPCEPPQGQGVTLEPAGDPLATQGAGGQGWRGAVIPAAVTSRGCEHGSPCGGSLGPSSSSPCSPLKRLCQVPSSRLRGARPRQRQVRLPPKRVGLPAGCPQAEGGLPQWPLVLEVTKERGARLPHSGLRRLRPRQRGLPHPPEVTAPPRSVGASGAPGARRAQGDGHFLEGRSGPGLAAPGAQVMCLWPVLGWLPPPPSRCPGTSRPSCQRLRSSVGGHAPGPALLLGL